jgi:glycosyltransferase involved in cell wall biosynthesis
MLLTYYGRESSVIHPPVETDFFTPSGVSREPFYLIVSALVPYKRIEVAIEAFNRLAHLTHA